MAEQLETSDDVLDAFRDTPPWDDEDGSSELASALRASLPSVDARELVRLRRELLEELQSNSEGGESEFKIAIGSSMAERLADLLLLGAAAIERQKKPLEIAVQIEGGAVQGVVSSNDDPRPFHLYVHDHDLEASDRNDDEHATVNFEDGGVSVASLDVQTRGHFTLAPSDGPFWTSLRSEATRLLEID